jgi:O-antigen/teichoic acid export membrane protein
MKKPALLVAYRAFSDVAGKGAYFVITILAARRLSQEAFGVFALATTVGWIAAVASDFGMQMHLARSVARAPADGKRLLQVWLRMRAITAALALVLIAAGLLVTGAGARFGIAVVLFAVVYLTGGLVEFLHYFYRGLGRSDVESTLTLWQRFGTLGCAAAALWLRADIGVLAAAMLIPSAATFIYSLRLARKLAGSEGPGLHTIDTGRAGPFGPAVARTFSEFLHDVAPIGVGILLSALYFRIDLFLVQLWRGTDAVALYNAVFRLVEALRLFPAAVLAVMLPRLVRAATPRPLVQVSTALTAFGLALASVLWVSAGWLVPFLYGAAYVDAVRTFRILLLSFPLMSLNYALTHQLIGWNGHRAYAGVCLAALVFNVALNARLIPAMSFEGAAWATLWTEGVLTLGCVAALWLGIARRNPQAVTVTVAS